MSNALTSSYYGYAIFICFASGCLLLIIDVKEYSKKNMQREKKTARITGWFNLSLSVVGFLLDILFT
jgi:hypothetical protein